MERVRYRGIVFDSARWEGFGLRAGDIVISTPPKCGTTWMQMICALLVFRQGELPGPLSAISPWIDMVTRARTDVFAHLGAQQHRRIIKTHTPLDGLPHDPSVTYIVVGRDPRDVAISMDNHLANLDLDEFARSRAEAARIDGIEPPPLAPPPPRAATPIERFWAFVEDDTDTTNSSPRLRFLARHLQSFWDAPAELDVVLVHYDELQEDLPARMRALAGHLGITVPEATWPELVQAASWAEMRARAERTVPGATPAQWHDPAKFFHKGTSGQWRELLDEGDLARYFERVHTLVSPDLAEWLHRP
ncbi:MAG: sulfotransferase domain-containing protein [Acidimicrobiales bacterium]|nr:sulfotransferase domain-containing protein [Acidimicrobiales bacterium]